MREILFRGKRIDNKKWMEGCYAVVGERKVIIAPPEMFYDENAKQCYGSEIKEIDPKTVCQYTGLTDRNGRKIFEGDILKSDLGRIGKIAFNESHMAFMILEFAENKYYHVEECSGNHMEVIGNIYDNPELLEVG